MFFLYFGQHTTTLYSLLCISQLQLCPSPPHPRLPWGIRLPYQSRGWALANFAWPGGWAFANPGAPKFLTRRPYPNITKRNMEDFTENTSRSEIGRLVHLPRTGKSCGDFWRHIFSILCMHFPIAYQVRITERNRELLMWVNVFFWVGFEYLVVMILLILLWSIMIYLFILFNYSEQITLRHTIINFNVNLFLPRQ